MSFLGLIFRSLRYKTCYFFDTSFIVTKEPVLDKRLKKLYQLSNENYLTDTILAEVKEKQDNKNFREIGVIKYKTLAFNDLYSKFPVCPVYHNYIAAMLNPANIGSSDFAIQLAFAHVIKGDNLSVEDLKAYSGFMDLIAKSSKSSFHRTGKKKTELDKILDETHLRSLQKRKRGLSRKDKNFLNDLRNLSLIFTYAVFHNKNVVFVTADSDSIAYFLDWVDSLVHQIVFHTKYLEKLDQKERTDLFSKKNKSIHFSYRSMRDYINGTLQNYFSNNRKYFSPRLSIKFWDKNRKKYFNVGINIDKHVREIFSKVHGPLNCPTAKNSSHGCFIAYKYWWPPKEGADHDDLEILPILKPIYKYSERISPHIHDKMCRYRKAEIKGDFESFSTFQLEWGSN